MDYLIFIIITIIAILVFSKISNYIYYLPVKGYDGNTYYLNKCDNCDTELSESANMLAKINENILILIGYLRKNEPSNKVTIFLHNHYSPNLLYETIPETQYTSYTEDKRKIHLCLRTRDENKKIYNINLLMYVMLHELAHFSNFNDYGLPIIGHGKEFKEKFYFLVDNAIKAKVYVFDDYSENNQNYCGLNLKTNIYSNV